jgi:DNA gyrase/topoisomerase IV subunit B
MQEIYKICVTEACSLVQEAIQLLKNDIAEVKNIKEPLDEKSREALAKRKASIVISTQRIVKTVELIGKLKAPSENTKEESEFISEEDKIMLQRNLDILKKNFMKNNSAAQNS